MERPLHFRSRQTRAFAALARALLYAEPTAEAHAALIGLAFAGAPSRARLLALARRTLDWTGRRPQPRAKALVELLRKERLFQRTCERHTLANPIDLPPPRMRPLPGAGALPALETVGQFAEWLHLRHTDLLWFADLQGRNAVPSSSPCSHYSTRVLMKRDGSMRLIESPKSRLKQVQRQILAEILAAVPLHPAVHGFRKQRSVVSFAAPHAGRPAVLRLDLQDFFPSISGPRVQALFRTLGYPESVADLLGGLCTNTVPRSFWAKVGNELEAFELERVRMLYARTHLPQGAPTSPALANLCAFRLDRRLAGLAGAAGATYTRYADDLAFSGDASFARGAGRFALRVAAVTLEEGFRVQHRKTRLMRPSVRQHLAGLTLNSVPHVPRKELKELEAVLTNCVRRGPATQNRENHHAFRQHLQGRVAFAMMVNAQRALTLRALFDAVDWR